MIKPQIALKALDKSINHWKQIVENLNIPIGPHQCPLCKVYWKTHQGRCSHCPICKFTSQICCLNTPYADAECDLNRTSANAELTFLYEVRLFWINRMNK